MARYIDVDKIDFSPLKDDFDRARAVTIVKFQPTADVVEVVRCKDCKYRYDYKDRIMCSKNAHMREYGCVGLRATNIDDFCSYGERK